MGEKKTKIFVREIGSWTQIFLIRHFWVRICCSVFMINLSYDQDGSITLHVVLAYNLRMTRLKKTKGRKSF